MVSTGSIDHRCRGLGAQPPAAEEVLIFKSIQSIENYNVLYLRPLSIINYELATLEASYKRWYLQLKCWYLLLLLLPPSLITDTESASDGKPVRPYNTVLNCLNVIANNAKTVDLISILNHLTIITANKDRLHPT